MPARNNDELAWATAFTQVLGVGQYYYYDTHPTRKRWLEQHYKELATHDSKKGRRAAKVVTEYTRLRLGAGHG